MNCGIHVFSGMVVWNCRFHTIHRMKGNFGPGAVLGDEGEELLPAEGIESV
jgi:hypothetical protein